MACLLAACAAQTAPPKPAPPPQTAIVEPPPPVHPSRRLRVVPRPERKPTPPGETAAAAPPPPRSPQVGELIGLDQRAASRLFGAAAERSDKPPATVWRYRTDSCELDLYFYLDLKSGRMRTLHYAFKGDSGDTAKRQECLRAIVDRGRKGPAPDAASAHR